MNDSIFAFVIVAGLWGLALREYLRQHRSDWAVLALGTLVGLAAVSLAAWDLVADLGRRGDLAIAVTVLILVLWSFVVWRHM
jgi:biotin transporter BioY